jgi:hypothetical protein
VHAANRVFRKKTEITAKYAKEREEVGLTRGVEEFVPNQALPLVCGAAGTNKHELSATDALRFSQIGISPHWLICV